MQTLTITDELTAQKIATDIVTLIHAESSLSVYAVGSNAIEQTISGISKAKKLLSEEKIVLNVRPVVSEQSVEGDETVTSITFQVISTPLFIEISTSNLTNETITQASS